MLQVLKKGTQGYNYKYTELADIVKSMAELGLDYKQYTETDPNTLKDYMWTIIIRDGKEDKPLRGCEIVMATLQGKSNPAQEMGSSITYARRYSLLMALGWATDDDDAESMTGTKKAQPQKPMQTIKPGQDIDPLTSAQLEILKNKFEKLKLPIEDKRKLMQDYKFRTLESLSKINAERLIEHLTRIAKAQEVKNG